MCYVWSKAIVFPFSRIGFLKEIFCGLCETGTDFIRFRNQFLKFSDYPVFVDAPCVRKVNILWSNTNQIIYLTTRPSFQATRIVAARNLNMKVVNGLSLIIVVKMKVVFQHYIS
jgi:hypothetical protein